MSEQDRNISNAAAALGRLGGKGCSEAKRAALRRNGQRTWDKIRSGELEPPKHMKKLHEEWMKKFGKKTQKKLSKKIA